MTVYGSECGKMWKTACIHGDLIVWTEVCHAEPAVFLPHHLLLHHSASQFSFEGFVLSLSFIFPVLSLSLPAFKFTDQTINILFGEGNAINKRRFFSAHWWQDLPLTKCEGFILLGVFKSFYVLNNLLFHPLALCEGHAHTSSHPDHTQQPTTDSRYMLMKPSPSSVAFLPPSLSTITFVPKCLISDGAVNLRKMPPNGSDERDARNNL